MRQSEKVKLYETVFHRISMLHTAMNGELLREQISRICDWSYAHRMGNGELTQRQTEAAILARAKRLIP